MSPFFHLKSHRQRLHTYRRQRATLGGQASTGTTCFSWGSFQFSGLVVPVVCDGNTAVQEQDKGKKIIYLVHVQSWRPKGFGCVSVFSSLSVHIPPIASSLLSRVTPFNVHPFLGLLIIQDDYYFRATLKPPTQKNSEDTIFFCIRSFFGIHFGLSLLEQSLVVSRQGAISHQSLAHNKPCDW